MGKDVEIEKIEAEMSDDYSDDSLFNIASWGADLSFREIIYMYQEDELVKPELQRKYVWDKNEASRFIESLLMGLPVPSVFFAQQGSQKLIVDGYQRIMTVYDYVKGVFSGDKKIFRLSNSEKINERWRNKAFSELSIDDQRKIKSTTIHAIIFEQKKPENDDTSMYQIFERINTSGRILTPQEIRNCVYQGALNTLLFELNKMPEWRKLFGSMEEDSRMRDIECILRYFVMKSEFVRNSKAKQISLKKTLNEYMGKYKNVSVDEANVMKEDFTSTIKCIYEEIGEHAFNNATKKENGISRKFNPALFDAIVVAYYKNLKETDIRCKSNVQLWRKLFENTEFVNACKMRTTDIDNINKRVEIAYETLFQGKA